MLSSSWKPELNMQTLSFSKIDRFELKKLDCFMNRFCCCCCPVDC